MFFFSVPRTKMGYVRFGHFQLEQYLMPSQQIILLLFYVYGGIYRDRCCLCDHFAHFDLLLMVSEENISQRRGIIQKRKTLQVNKKKCHKSPTNKYRFWKITRECCIIFLVVYKNFRPVDNKICSN